MAAEKSDNPRQLFPAKRELPQGIELHFVYGSEKQGNQKSLPAAARVVYNDSDIQPHEHAFEKGCAFKGGV